MFQHDPETVSECVPGGENGNYIMFARNIILYQHCAAYQKLKMLYLWDIDTKKHTLKKYWILRTAKRKETHVTSIIQNQVKHGLNIVLKNS